MTIRTKQFQLLTDAELAWELMTDVFTPDECNGPAAPFFEYALDSCSMRTIPTGSTSSSVRGTKPWPGR